MRRKIHILQRVINASESVPWWLLCHVTRWTGTLVLEDCVILCISSNNWGIKVYHPFKVSRLLIVVYFPLD